MAISAEQEALKQLARDLLADSSTEQPVRRLMADRQAVDPALWAALADLGLLGLNIPAALGGAGAGLVEVGVFLEEAGRALLVAPYLSTVVLGTTAILALDNPSFAALTLPKVADGSLTVTVAFEGPDSTTAQQDHDGTWRLSGVKDNVLDGATASMVLVPAWADEGLALFAVNDDAEGLRREPLTTLDETRPQARLVLEDVPTTLVSKVGAAEDVLAHVLDVAAVCLAAEQVGGAARAMEMSIEHAKAREQFGRPIGSFQAVKHACADMLLSVEAARSAAAHGLRSADDGADDLPLVARIAAVTASKAFCEVTASCIQVHGGIGFTWEHPAHLYYKRARGGSVLLGSAGAHRDRVAELVGL